MCRPTLLLVLRVGHNTVLFQQLSTTTQLSRPPALLFLKRSNRGTEVVTLPTGPTAKLRFKLIFPPPFWLEGPLTLSHISAHKSDDTGAYRNQWVNIAVFLNTPSWSVGLQFLNKRRLLKEHRFINKFDTISQELNKNYGCFTQYKRWTFFYFIRVCFDKSLVVQ